MAIVFLSPPALLSEEAFEVTEITPTVVVFSTTGAVMWWLRSARTALY
jgi:hypothetical protein